MARAEEYGIHRDHEKITEEPPVKVVIHTQEVRHPPLHLPPPPCSWKLLPFYRFTWAMTST